VTRTLSPTWQNVHRREGEGLDRLSSWRCQRCPIWSRQVLRRSLHSCRASMDSPYGMTRLSTTSMRGTSIPVIKQSSAQICSHSNEVIPNLGRGAGHWAHTALWAARAKSSEKSNDSSVQNPPGKHFFLISLWIFSAIPPTQGQSLRITI